MNIIILGHSNSILKDGWLSHLKESLPQHDYINLSIGGSPSPALLYQAVCHREVIASADLIIVEPTVVDHGEQWQTGPGVAGQAAKLFGWLRTQTAAPILLLILPRTEAWLRQPSQGMRAWHGSAQQYGVQVVDGRMGIVRYCAEHGLELSAAWRDNMGHTVSLAQLEVARDVSQAIAELAPQPTGRPLQGNADFRVLSGADVAARQALEVRHHSTALLSTACVVLTGETAILVDGDADLRLLGMAINFGALNPVNAVTFRAQARNSQSTTFKVSNPFMGPGPLHRPYVMFTAVHVGHDVQALSIDAIDQARFAPGAAESIEIAGLLLGPAIAPVHDWMPPAPLADLAV